MISCTISKSYCCILKAHLATHPVGSLRWYRNLRLLWSVITVNRVPSTYGRSFSIDQSTAKHSFSVPVKFLSAAVSTWLMKTTGCSPSVTSCVNTTPIAESLKSVWITNGWLKSGRASTGASVKAFFKPSNAICWSCSQTHGTSLWKSLTNGNFKLANSPINQAYQPIIPRNLRNCFRLVGAGYSIIGSTFFSAGRNPSASTTKPT